MDPEKSIILTELRDRYNRIVTEHQGGEPPDVVEIENDILDDIAVIPQSVIEEIQKRAQGCSEPERVLAAMFAQAY